MRYRLKAAIEQARRPGERSARGQALVEFTLMLPIILMLLIGLLEFGMLLKDHMGIHYASREGARFGASASRDPAADCFILDAISTTMKTMEIDRLVLVRIYRADPDSAHYGECLPFNGLGQGPCPENIYYPGAATPPRCTQYNLTQGAGWVYDYPPHQGSVEWPPEGDINTGNPGRSNTLDDVHTPDTIGVEVRYNHPFFFKYVPGALDDFITIFDRTFTQIEPERFRPVPGR
jgi:hypothetical protein